MDWLEVIQTVGICLNSIFLLAITYMIFRLGSELLGPSPMELEDMLAEMDDDKIPEFLRGKSPEEISEMLRTPIYSMPEKKPRKKK